MRVKARGVEGHPITEKGTLSRFKEIADAGDYPVNLLDLKISVHGPPKLITRITSDHLAIDATRHALPPQDIQQDIWDTRSFALLSSAGFYTFPHVDGSGVCTHVAVTHGSKWWAFIWPQGDEEPSDMDVGQYKMLTKHAFEIYCRIAKYSNEYRQAAIELPEHVTVHIIKLVPGMLLSVLAFSVSCTC